MNRWILILLNELIVVISNELSSKIKRTFTFWWIEFWLIFQTFHAGDNNSPVTRGELEGMEEGKGREGEGYEKGRRKDMRREEEGYEKGRRRIWEGKEKDMRREGERYEKGRSCCQSEKGRSCCQSEKESSVELATIELAMYSTIYNIHAKILAFLQLPEFYIIPIDNITLYTWPSYTRWHERQKKK